MSHLLDVGFVEALDLYRAAGWARVFPLPAKAKDPPPDGLTGRNGHAPGPDTLAVFRGAAWDCNLGVAMPQDIIGIDVDQYADKRGAEELAALEARLGVRLPPTVRSSSRGPDNLSGIYLYRVPPGLDWRGELCPGVELINWHHRYAVVWPSVHPEGRGYRWYEDSGDMLEQPPLVAADHPDLPWQFVAHATKDPDVSADYQPAGPQVATRSQWHHKVAAKLDEYTRLNGGSRHETARSVSMALARHEQLGLAGATSALDQLGHRFVADVTPDRGDPRTAAGEWGRLLDGARYKAQTSESTVLRDRAQQHQREASLSGNGNQPPPGVDPDTGEITAEPPAIATRLPDEFWASRPRLAHIRRAAHARQRSADAVLHVVLARIAAVTPHTTLLPAIVGSPKPLCYFTAPIATPGIGKSDANSIGCELVPAPGYVADQLPLGTGEGLAEVLFDLVEELDDNDKKRTVKRQVRHNAYVFVDEGQILGEIGGRNGATLLPTLRSIWTGGVLGQSNASRERHRIVPALSYTYGVVAGFQAARVGPLLDDVDAGTPQRFGWVYATDPTVPDRRPDWPGPLDWTPPPKFSGGRHLEVAPEIADEIAAADLARVRGEAAVDLLDAHGGLYRLKIAGILAVLDGRLDINNDDWALAGIIKTASDAVRTNVVGALAYEQNRKEQAARERHARREVEADTATHRTRVVDGARKIASKVHSEPERWTVADLRRSLSRRHREVWDDALDHALAEHWVKEQSEPGQRGGDKRCLRPGEKRL
jgi:Bifunctional DNA primase/polymerase, N-terminal